eukprot:936570-Prorocentrum_minimum.AAC.3
MTAATESTVGTSAALDPVLELIGHDWSFYENNKNVANTLAYFLKPSGKAFISAQPTRGNDVPEFIEAARALGLSVKGSAPSATSMERAASQANNLRYGGDVDGHQLLIVEWSSSADSAETPATT